VKLAGSNWQLLPSTQTSTMTTMTMTMKLTAHLSLLQQRSLARTCHFAAQLLTSLCSLTPRAVLARNDSNFLPDPLFLPTALWLVDTRHQRKTAVPGPGAETQAPTFTSFTGPFVQYSYSYRYQAQVRYLYLAQVHSTSYKYAYYYYPPARPYRTGRLLYVLQDLLLVPVWLV
jgi:hypothetical protein